MSAKIIAMQIENYEGSVYRGHLSLTIVSFFATISTQYPVFVAMQLRGFYFKSITLTRRGVRASINLLSTPHWSSSIVGLFNGKIYG